METVRAIAYKFDTNTSHHAQSSHMRKFHFKKPGHSKKQDNTIHAYVETMKQFTHFGMPWAKEYVGENIGSGVKGMKGENRNMA